MAGPHELNFSPTVLTGFVPVCAFLVGLVYLDSYKLVSIRRILRAILVGCLAAGAAYVVNSGMIRLIGDHQQLLTHGIAPVVEEGLKAVLIILMLRSGRIGFLVDAAIYGFAIGTGFALVENVYYFLALRDASVALWLIRGFGTAVMHGGTTTLFGITAKLLADRRNRIGLTVIGPPLLLAAFFHSLFNQFHVSPMASTAIVILALPPLIVFVFWKSEKFLQGWLGSGFDVDSELLRLLSSGELSDSKVGQYLKSLRDHFRPEVMVDMICYLRLHVELSLRAKGILLMRENGFPVQKDAEIEDRLQELKFLESSIGATGKLALAPVLHTTVQDLWQISLLEG